MKNFGSKLIVIPTTSIKDSTRINNEYEMKIEQSDGTFCLLHLDEIRTIDSMRISQDKPYASIRTARDSIIEKLSSTIFAK